MYNYKNYWLNKKDFFNTICFKERKQLIHSLDNASQSQAKVLQNLINLNADTEFGRNHSFSKIKSISDFKKSVKITDYNGYLKLIEDEIKNKGGVLNSSPILRLLKTSGSTGNPKKIPLTKYWLEISRNPALYALWANYIYYCPDILDNPFATLDLSTVREKTQTFLNGFPYQGISNRNSIVDKYDWAPPWYEAPWFNENSPSKYDTKMYYRLRYLLGKDLHAIVSINPSTLISLHSHIVMNREKLIKEIYDGTVDNIKVFDKMPQLAISIEKTVSDTNFSMNDLWPNLSMISCWTSSSTQLYIPRLKILYPKAKILPYMACGSEGIVAIPIDDSSEEAPVAVNHGFYEFIDSSVDIDAVINGRITPETLLFNQLENGHEYHLVMSQANGLYRYVNGDLYKVSGYYKNVPKIKFSRRHGTFYSFTGEKLTETQLLESIKRVSKKFGGNDWLFMFCPVFSNIPYYKVLLETSNNGYIDPLRIQKELDMALCELNTEYSSKRESNRLMPIKVITVPAGTIDCFQETQRHSKNAVQFKYKPFVKDENILNSIIQMAKEKAVTR